ncbi:MAG: hypothetical protein J3R72DRAFT_472983 [Linnemannia gamsii]|nr:MAG: hypothetical protein J3R72DRAFT_472983 [Linnemannia gamsii]
MAHSITLSVLAFLSVPLHVMVVSAALEPGTYFIHNGDGPLAVGPDPLIYPPPDVPVRIMGGFNERWIVAKNANGHYTIGAYGGYKIADKKNESVFVSHVMPALAVAVESADGNQYTISVPNEDRVFTYKADVFPQIIFEPADGSSAQKWSFMSAEREL